MQMSGKTKLGKLSRTSFKTLIIVENLQASRALKPSSASAEKTFSGFPIDKSLPFQQSHPSVPPVIPIFPNKPSNVLASFAFQASRPGVRLCPRLIVHEHQLSPERICVRRVRPCVITKALVRARVDFTLNAATDDAGRAYSGCKLLMPRALARANPDTTAQAQLL